VRGHQVEAFAHIGFNPFLLFAGFDNFISENLTMKKISFVLLLIPVLGMAQKKEYFFAEGGVNFYRGKAPAVIDFTYSYAPLSKFGFGISAELGQHETKYYYDVNDYRSSLTFGCAILADIRYYLHFKNGSLIPLFQIGYNVFNDHVDPNFKTVGGLQYSLGLGYLFKVFKSGGGVIVSVKYIDKSFKETDATLVGKTSHNYSVGGFAPTVGILF
jgi:hypothetical protein